MHKLIKLHLENYKYIVIKSNLTFFIDHVIHIFVFNVWFKYTFNFNMVNRKQLLQVFFTKLPRIT